jgi:hypothetical protein
MNKLGAVLEGKAVVVLIRRPGERPMVVSIKLDAGEVLKLRDMGFGEIYTSQGWSELPEVLT